MHISYEFKSPNYDERPAPAVIDFIILHYTEMTFEGALDRLRDADAKVSCHYLIKEDGKIFQLVNDEMRAWHAGKSRWQGREALNDCSIGIEIDNSGVIPFADLQMAACISLCKALMDKHRIPSCNIIGHSDIAPNRKLDPGIYFDWQRLADQGLGIYSGDDSSLRDYKASETTEFEVFNVQAKLASIGYDLNITGQWDNKTNAVIRAFQAHFCQKALRKKGIEFYRNMNSKYLWDEESDKRLHSLYKSKVT